jgi:hypothetical protein
MLDYARINDNRQQHMKKYKNKIGCLLSRLGRLRMYYSSSTSGAKQSRINPSPGISAEITIG